MLVLLGWQIGLISQVAFDLILILKPAPLIRAKKKRGNHPAVYGLTGNVSRAKTVHQAEEKFNRNVSDFIFFASVSW